MIQKNSMANQQKLVIQLICEDSLEFYIEKTPLNKANFPIFQITYTIWRACAYQRMKKAITKNGQFTKNHIIQFYQISEKKYLPKFISRIEKQMNLYCRGVRNVQQGIKQLQKIPKQEQQIYNIVLQLGNCVWSQQLYVQIIQDLTRLPYLDVIFKAVTPKQEYVTQFIFQRRKYSKLAEIANKTGKSVFNKILNGLTNAVFSKAFVFKINTLFGSFNPIVLGATLGMSQYLKHLDKKNKDQTIQNQLKSALQFTKKKLQFLKETHKKIIQKVEKIIKQCNNQVEIQCKKQLKQLFLQVFEQQWLHIEVNQDQNGWEIIKIQEKQSFQQLTD